MSDGHYYGDLSFIGIQGYSLTPEGLIYQKTGNILNFKNGKVQLVFANGEKHSSTLDMIAFCADNGIPLQTMRNKRIDKSRQREKYIKRYKNLVKSE